MYLSLFFNDSSQCVNYTLPLDDIHAIDFNGIRPKIRIFNISLTFDSGLSEIVEGAIFKFPFFRQEVQFSKFGQGVGFLLPPR